MPFVLPLPLRLFTAAVLTAACVRAGTVALTQLDLSQLHIAGLSRPGVDTAFTGKPLSVGGKKFEHGLGTRATTTVWLELDGEAQRFTALVGVDDSATNRAASIRVKIVGDGRKLWDSGIIKRGQPAKPIAVDLRGIHSLLLSTDHGTAQGAQNYADWIDAQVEFAGAPPRSVNKPDERPEILTPPPGAAPRLNSAKVYGCRPGHPFLFRIPTTGERPLKFSAAGLPPTLQLDPATGIITGTAPERGEYAVTLRARNRHGEQTRAFRIVSGDKLALTPPMGWNHWYAHYNRITDAMVREAADRLVQTGMADVGYSYVNIDDCWANTAKFDEKRKPDTGRIGPLRDSNGNVLPNQHFPDMRALTDYIHRRGLKAGIYTSPGPLTCGSYAGAYQHEEQDARQFAAWGFDFLKYDLCSYRQMLGTDHSVAAVRKPYEAMGAILQRLPRDIVYNLCEYGLGDVWEWGADVGGQSWRTGGDLGHELNRLFPVALKNAEHGKWSRPGGWNDPDYIQIGYIGVMNTDGEVRPSPLTATEQYSFMSLWSLMASPLFFSGDMRQLDAFTLNVLCNPEVIEIDQDPLGESARVVMLSPETFVMLKHLEDGSMAVGFGNSDECSREVAATWRELGLPAMQRVRDVWRERDLGESAQFTAVIPRHGVVLLRVTPPTR